MNSSYVFSLWVKSSETGQIAIGNKIVETTTSWEKVKIVFNAAEKNLTPRIAAGEYWIYQIQLETGNIETDWAPSNKDIQENVDIANTNAGTALDNSAVAIATADGKNTAYYMASMPSGNSYKLNDIWYNTSSGYKMSYWNGTAWLETQFGESALATDAVTSGKIAAGAVTTAKLYALSVTTEKIAVGAVNADKIAANAITAVKIAAGAVETDKLAANAVTAAKIAAGTITATEIAGETITGDKIVAGTITGNKIAAKTITANNIVANTITSAQIAAGTITATELSAGAVTTAKLDAGAVTAEKLNVSSLSAISANLGTVTAGTINGITINSSELNGVKISGDRMEISTIIQFTEINSEAFIVYDGPGYLMTISAFGIGFTDRTTGHGSYLTANEGLVRE